MTRSKKFRKKQTQHKSKRIIVGGVKINTTQRSKKSNLPGISKSYRRKSKKLDKVKIIPEPATPIDFGPVVTAFHTATLDARLKSQRAEDAAAYANLLARRAANNAARARAHAQRAADDAAEAELQSQRVGFSHILFGPPGSFHPAWLDRLTPANQLRYNRYTPQNVVMGVPQASSPVMGVDMTLASPPPSHLPIPTSMIFRRTRASSVASPPPPPSQLPIPTSMMFRRTRASSVR
jgi:hypothetical protein